MMEKNVRFSGGYYDNVDEAGESEGSGSSGRINTAITASANSSAPVRKSSIVDSDKRDRFGVPIQVLNFSSMLPSERKDLVYKLRVELDQIQSLQKKVELQRTNGATLSSSSNIPTSSYRRGGPSVKNIQQSSIVTSGPSKKPNPPSHSTSGLKRGTAGRFVSTKEAPITNAANKIVLKQCEALLKKLMSNQESWPFNSPVDVVKLNLPDYFTIIKHPMDLGTIKSKIASGAYSGPLDFLADVRLTFSNAMTYNPPGNYVHTMADNLSKFFELKWIDIERKIPVTRLQSLTANSSSHNDIQTSKAMPSSKKRKVASVQSLAIPEPIVERIMTEEEKHKLGRELEALMEDMPTQIVDFLRAHSSNGRECGDDEIEIDIDDLSDDTLFKLRRILDDYLQDRQKALDKAEPCEIELLHESGPSSSSVQPGRGCDPVDEDVDIGGNEPPVSSYPPVVIEKDSDSVSNTYSDKEAGFKANPLKDSIDIEGKVEKNNEFTGNQSVSGLDQVDHGQMTQEKPSSVELDDGGDSAPTERQVSPDKLYRAALLKNRFADTILKAQEKTLKQGEKVDPDKLRKEKELLELQRRKEKARLQAEAKAAEDARRRAEAEAAAEAKRQRDVEREAARQALLQMEKTVEIHEDSQFLQDLEMLRAAPAEVLPSSVDESSPDHSPDGLGSFKFGGNNPLEQLGLYMKEDEEEEDGEADHVHPKNGPILSIPDAVNDVEEGEID